MSNHRSPIASASSSHRRRLAAAARREREAAAAVDAEASPTPSADPADMSPEQRTAYLEQVGRTVQALPTVEQREAVGTMVALVIRAGGLPTLDAPEQASAVVVNGTARVSRTGAVTRA